LAQAISSWLEPTLNEHNEAVDHCAMDGYKDAELGKPPGICSATFCTSC